MTLDRTQEQKGKGWQLVNLLCHVSELPETKSYHSLLQAESHHIDKTTDFLAT